MRTLIENLSFAFTVDARDTVFSPAAMVVNNDRIEDIGPTGDVLGRHSRESFDEIIDGSGKGLCPGFVDTHVHLSETLSRGVFPDNLNTRAWVFHWAKPFYAHVTDEDEYISVLLGVGEMLRCGTTCLLDMGAQNDPGVTVRAMQKAGIRGITGRHAADNPPEKIPPGWSDEMVRHHFFPNTETALRTLGDCVEQWNNSANGRIRCWVNIEGKEPCTLALHVGARALAEKLGVGTTYHLATSIEEAHVCQKKHNLWPISRIEKNDGLGDNLVIAHGVAVADHEIALLAKHDTKIAFCPSSSLKLGKGAAKIGKYPELMDAGVSVGLGTDGVSASGNLNLMRQMFVVAGLFKDARIDSTQIGVRRALRMATIEGARVLNWDDQIGSLEKGKKTDFILFDLNHFEWTPYLDPLQALVWSASPASIAQTWVDGKALYKNGKVLTLNEPKLYKEARQRAIQISNRAGLVKKNIPTTTTLYD